MNISVFQLDVARYSSGPMNLKSIIGALLRNPGYGACVLLRLQQAAVRQHRMLLARSIRHVAIAIYGADFVPGTAVGPNLLLPHPSGVVIGRGAVIGKNCTILQHVTIGEKDASGKGPHLYPRIGDDVVIGAGAKLLGHVDVGDSCSVGANAVVLTSAPDESTLIGVPAQVRPKRDQASGIQC